MEEEGEPQLGQKKGELVYLGNEGNRDEEYAQERGNEGLDI